ncbi:MAG: phenylalanine--tRNA ligase subunit beta [Planctomycetota bacterium]|nr:MAG: phenylalanine--tRNA ligase subunit beta [Planctomycetota bacterium]
MLISLNWLRDYVDLPADLDPRALAERITLTTAEVEDVRPVSVDAKGLIAARVTACEAMPDRRNLRRVRLDVGGGKTVQTVSAAPVLPVGANVVYAPPGAGVRGHETIGVTTVAGVESHGVILPGESIGIPLAVQEAIFLPPDVEAGEVLPPELFEDWVLEIDNKSITHRPDLWGHYGMAREVAAIFETDLKPYPVADRAEVELPDLPEVPIEIRDATACRRYTGLVLEGVPAQPAPLWMQLRLGHVGLRPITGLVDLTNYIMLDLGQPMHAFDADKVDRIEVDWAKEGERFRTLDGAERVLTERDLMIQCRGRSVALAGVMGGLESEVTESTTRLLLESANFDPATIRRTAIRLGLRTDASARFEKSLDPAHTVVAVLRFVHLARAMYPGMRIAGRLSDAYPKPASPVHVAVNPSHVERTIGRPVPVEDIRRLLEPLGFSVAQQDGVLSVSVPSFRATGDVSLEADIVEEIARFIGYNRIEPALPRVSVRRFEPNALHELEQRTLRLLTLARGFFEIHGYLWYDAEWMQRLGADPGACLELRNPPAQGLHRLRKTLMPNLLAAVVRNRHHFPALALVELGSVFEPGRPEDREFRHVGLLRARRGKQTEPQLYDRLKLDLEHWGWELFARRVSFHAVEADRDRPWEHEVRTAAIRLDGREVGRLSAVDVGLRQVMDEHLAAWSIVWAEIRLDELVEWPSRAERPGTIPAHPLVEMDFSVVVEATRRYESVAERLAGFDHPLLRQLRFMGSYEGGSVGEGKRSLTFRTAIGRDDRTLTEDDTRSFREAFESFLQAQGLDIRR